MNHIHNVKTVLLSLVIVLGLVAQTKSSNAQQLETLTVAGGCFWCVEADFEKVNGVVEAVSGFSGGTVENPTYKLGFPFHLHLHGSLRITFCLQRTVQMVQHSIAVDGNRRYARAEKVLQRR